MNAFNSFTVTGYVLILVLMEDTLRDIGANADEESSRTVLILVLMEDTLRARVS